MIRVGIFGATGYAGFELVKILQQHSDVEIVFTTSHSFAGQMLSDIYATAPDLPLIAGSEAPLHETDVVFLCLPHAAAAETAVRALVAGNRVVDLSADFRINNVETYNAWYDHEHPAPHLLDEAVYGLTEFARESLPSANLVANPGCYPTSVLLPLNPLLKSGIKLGGTIIADSKSGVSGAGRTPKQNTHFVEVSNNFSPYKIGRSHRHLPEMEQVLGWWREDPPQLLFSPHLLPVERGILSTIYVPLAEPVDEGRLREVYGRIYQDEPFITVLPQGKLATLAHVTHTNRCVMALTMASNTLIITSAIDNLQKGAAGQAVQNLNVMFGCDETAALVK
ncbi:MAG: N-acetyl-gamma-glutamyl-phosphate reductase [Chloroflexi bacterium]|nr:N-acetyl-gamma-glutamyl-phosphate reductase [Chloroflexota bacterium]